MSRVRIPSAAPFIDPLHNGSASDSGSDGLGSIPGGSTIPGSSMVRASGLHPECCRFESYPGNHLMRPWRNWHTRRIKDPVPHGLWVQIPPGAPTSQLNGLRVIPFSIQTTEVLGASTLSKIATQTEVSGSDPGGGMFGGLVKWS